MIEYKMSIKELIVDCEIYSGVKAFKEVGGSFFIDLSELDDSSMFVLGERYRLKTKFLITKQCQ